MKTSGFESREQYIYEKGFSTGAMHMQGMSSQL